LVVHLVI